MKAGLAVAMHCLRRERRQAKRNVFSATRKWSRVAHPFATVRDHGLPGRYIYFARLMMHPQCAPQHHRVLVKLRSLTRLLPALRTTHVRHADAGSRGVDPPDILVNDLRLISSGFDARRMRNQGWHNGAAS